MKIISVFLFFLFINSGGCGDENKKSEAGYYFPIEKGNKWVYDDGGVEWTLESDGPRSINGTDYTAMVRNYQRSSDTAYYRIGGDDKVYIYWEGKEYLYIDFGRAEGDKWPTYNNFTAGINHRGKILVLPAGTFDNAVEVVFNNSALQDAFEFRDYAPGVGLVQITAFRRVSKLKSAAVNGVNYP